MDNIYKSIKGMPIGHKHLENGYTMLVDPIAEITKRLIDSYNDDIDRYVFSQLDTENNYIHIENPQMPQMDWEMVNSYKISYKILATKTIDRIFTHEKDIIDLQDIRTNLYQMDIDYKNLSFEECSRLIRRMKL